MKENVLCTVFIGLLLSCGILFVSVQSCSFQLALCSPKASTSWDEHLDMGKPESNGLILFFSSTVCSHQTLEKSTVKKKNPKQPKNQSNSYFSSHEEKLKKSPVKACRLCTMTQVITTLNKTYHGKCERALPLSPSHTHTHKPSCKG